MSESTYPTGIVGAPAPVLSFGPLVLPVPGRAVDLQVRVSAPATGSGLPVILLSHGHGPSNHLSSLNGYAPLASYWAAHGFVVIQPTHLDSKMLGLRDSGDPEAPLYWRSRAEDMTRILDQLDVIEAAVPQLPGRLDRSRVAVAGHSMGGHTASLLLGARLTDPRDGTDLDLAEPRIKAGVLLAAPGRGGDALSDFAATNYPFFTLFGAEHGLGGIAGYDAAETTDENPDRVAAVARLTWAYLRTELYPGDSAWQAARDELAADPDPLGRVESKQA
jgi:dienelactone hydrolase